MSASFAEAGASQRLFAHGGRVHSKSRAAQASGREVSGEFWILGQHKETGFVSDQPKQEERAKVDELRGTPMGVGTLEEMIDDNHAIVSSSVGNSFADRIARV
jgi:ATP-dependent 26S proteasome regulatory subunit